MLKKKVLALDFQSYFLEDKSTKVKAYSRICITGIVLFVNQKGNVFGTGTAPKDIARCVGTGLRRVAPGRKNVSFYILM